MLGPLQLQARFSLYLLNTFSNIHCKFFGRPTTAVSRQIEGAANPARRLRTATAATTQAAAAAVSRQRRRQRRQATRAHPRYQPALRGRAQFRLRRTSLPNNSSNSSNSSSNNNSSSNCLQIPCSMSFATDSKCSNCSSRALRLSTPTW